MQHIELGKARRPERTSSKPGWYSPRQASAKASQSTLYPSGSRIFSASRATDLRQSTMDPNTSKNRALGPSMGASAGMKSSPAAPVLSGGHPS